MGWELRRGKRYYYRRRKVNGRWIREYVGPGARGEQAALEDALRNAKKKAEMEAERRRREEFQAAQALLHGACEEYDRLIKAALIGAGYYEHKRQWRRRRARTRGS